MTLEVFFSDFTTDFVVMWEHNWPFVQETGVQISLEPNFFFLILIKFFKWKLFFTSSWYSKPLLYYSFFKFFMFSWQYLESKDIWGLRRVIELHIGKRRPFLFIISFAPSLGPLICLKSPLFNFRSAKLPNLRKSLFWISCWQLSKTLWSFSAFEDQYTKKFKISYSCH